MLATNHIKLDGLQKIQELDAEDKYKVLEFLVKEMMGVRDLEKQRDQAMQLERIRQAEDDLMKKINDQQRSSSKKALTEKKVKVDRVKIEDSNKYS